MLVVQEKLDAEFADKFECYEEQIGEVIYKLQKYIVRRWLLDEGKRVDGRNIDQIRPLAAEVGLLPRVHGSGLFTRGQTQVLTVATLGALSEVQKLDGLDNEGSKDTFTTTTSRHTVSAKHVPQEVPDAAKSVTVLWQSVLWARYSSGIGFPYAIRLVSEVLSSNGSTSQGSICGSTLALMDAGVPIKAPVAGISVGSYH